MDKTNKYFVNKFGLFKFDSDPYGSVLLECVKAKDGAIQKETREYEFEAEDDDAAILIYEIGGIDA